MEKIEIIFKKSEICIRDLSGKSIDNSQNITDLDTDKLRKLALEFLSLGVCSDDIESQSVILIFKSRNR
jgi:hypothetical protein